MKSAWALAFVLGLLGFIPLLGGPRYEAALVAGVIAPTWAGIWTFRRFLLRGAAAIRAKAVGVALEGAALHSAAILITATLHGLREGFCEPLLGYGLLLLGPCVGTLLATSASALFGVLAIEAGVERLSRKLLVALTFFAPLWLTFGSAAIRFWGFYSSPTVFAYDPFVGYFSGPLYDTVLYDLPRLLSFRVGTGLSITALLALSSALPALMAILKKRQIAAKTGSMKRGIGLAVFALVAQGSATVHAIQSDRLGHTQSGESLRAELGRQIDNGACRVIFSKGVQLFQARLVGQECRAHLAQLSRYFAVEAPSRVNVYLFSSSAEKKRLMGAGNTYIAKPWRREIYLQPRSFPHPVLGHELAHVMAGQFGQGPLRVAGPLGGLIPDPGRIEGFAVAAAPREHSDGTLHQWTAAMKELELLPRLGDLFQLSFFKSAAARSYNAAGSFVDFVHHKYGAGVLKRWYGGGDLETLTGESWKGMEASWHKFLDEVEVSEEVLAIAKPRFSRLGVFERRCPHAVDRAVAGARGSCSSQEDAARAYAHRAIELDPLRADLELEMPRCALYAEDTSGALAEIQEGLSREGRYSEHARKSAYDFLGNTLWRLGEHKEATAAFGEALELSYRRDARRQLEVKLWSLEQPAQTNARMQRVLAPGPDPEEPAAITLARWYEAADDKSLPAYLLSRMALGAGRLLEARGYMRDVDPSLLPLQSLRHEAQRGRALLACRLRMLGGSQEALGRALEQYKALDLSPVELFEVERLGERCEDAALRR